MIPAELSPGMIVTHCFHHKRARVPDDGPVFADVMGPDGKRRVGVELENVVYGSGKSFNWYVSNLIPPTEEEW